MEAHENLGAERVCFFVLHQSFDCNVSSSSQVPHLSGRCQKSQPERKQEARFLRLTDYWRCSLMHFLFVITFIGGFNNDDVRMSVCSGKMCEERKQRNSHATELWKNDIFSRPSLSSLALSAFASFFFHWVDFHFLCVSEAFVLCKLLPVKLS